MKLKNQIILTSLLVMMFCCICSVNAETEQTLNLPANLVVVGEQAFYQAKSLNKVVVPEGTTIIESKAFAYSSLQEISLPRSLTSIAEDAFEGCGQFKAKVPMNCYAYEWCVDHGYTVEIATTPVEDFEYEPINGLYARITKYSGSDDTVVIPDEIDDYIIQVIDTEAFFKNKEMKCVIIPDTVTEIGKQAFSYCDALETVDLGNGITTIGNWAFSDNPSLKHIDLPDSVTTMGRGVFLNCINLELFGYPVNWEHADEYGEVFAGCDKLTEIDVPVGTTVIPNYAFANCPNLQKVTLPEGLEYVYHHAFSDCTGLTEMVYPSTIKTVGGIDGCTGITEIDIPDGAVTIGTNAFDSVPISHIAIPSSVTEILNYAFENCEKLESVSFEEGLTSIGLYAFSGCTSLGKALLPDSVSSIGAYAFSDCSILNEFHYPKNWNTVTRAGTSSDYGHHFDNCVRLRKIDIPEGATVVPRAAFAYATYLRSVSFPNSIKSIGDEAFKGCAAITSIAFNSGIEKIGFASFEDCIYMTSANLPDSVESIGCYAFAGCSSLTDFHFPASWSNTTCSNNMWDGKYYLYWGHHFDGCTKLKKIEIQEGTTDIPAYAFSDAINISSVSFASTLTTVGYAAFEGCTGITSVDLPDSVESIGCYAFASCTNLSSFHYPVGWKYTYGASSPYHGKYYLNTSGHTFDGCTKLQNIDIPEGVERIPSYVFCDAIGLIDVSTPSTLKEVGKGAFESCSKLKKIYLSYDVNVIEDYAFDECPALTIWTEYGAYALQYAKDNSIPYYYLSPDGVNSPSGTLYKGDSYALYGYARASIPLTNVTATIWDSTGTNALQTISVNPATTDYNLAGTVNTSLIFGTLPLGNYRYTLIAKTDISEEVWANNSFTIVPPPLRIYISDRSVPSGYLALGDAENLSGTIVSNYDISQVVIELIDLSTGASVQRVQDTPYTMTYSLASAGININGLSEGEYNLIIVVTSNGETRTLVDECFVLGDINIPEGVSVDISKVLAFVGNTDNKLIFNKYNADYTGRLAENMSTKQQFLLGLRTNESKLIGQVRSLIAFATTGELKDYYLITLYKKEIANYLVSQGAIIDDTWSLTDKIKAECGFDAETMLKIVQSFVSFNSIRVDYLQNDASDMVVTKDMKAVYDIINQNLGRYSWELDRVEDLNEMGEKMAEICRDYAAGIAVLNDLENAMPMYLEDKAFQDAIRELKQEYLSRVSKNINKLFDYASKEAVKAGTKAIAKYVIKGISAEAYVTYKISKLAWNTIADLTGLYSDADTYIDYQSRCGMFYAAENAYIEAFEKCSGGDMSEMAIGRLIRTFEYTKSAGLRVIDKARSIGINGVLDSDLVQKKRGLEKLYIG